MFLIILLLAGVGIYQVLRVVSNFILAHISQKRHIREFRLSPETIDEGFRPNNKGRSIDLVVSSLRSQNVDVVFHVDYNN